MKHTAGKKLLAAAALVCLLVGVAGGLFAWRADSNRRGLCGRIVRLFRGEGLARQWTDDTAEDICRTPGLAALQQWATNTLARFRAGELATNGGAIYWFGGAVKLAPQEVPQFITQQWGEPEVTIMFSTNGHAECIGVLWYIRGIVIGPPDYRLSFQPYCSTQAKPGVYAYALEK